MKYRRKPIIVEAEQFDPEVTPWPAGVHNFLDGSKRFRFLGGMDALGSTIPICEIRVGDWVVTNPDSSQSVGARYMVTMFDFFDGYERIAEARNA